jgi:hypothetical protein
MEGVYYFRPRAEPTYSFFLVDQILEDSNTDLPKDELETILQESEVHYPKRAILDGTDGVWLPSLPDILVIYSVDEEACVEISDSRLEIGKGRFVLPKRLFRGIRLKLRHKGFVEVELKYMKHECMNCVEQIAINMVLEENNELKMYTMKGGFISRCEGAQKREHLESIIQSLLDIGFLHKTPDSIPLRLECKD